MLTQRKQFISRYFVQTFLLKFNKKYVLTHNFKFCDGKKIICIAGLATKFDLGCDILTIVSANQVFSANDLYCIEKPKGNYLMKNIRKTFIAAMLASVIGLTGCNVSDEPAKTHYDYTQDENSIWTTDSAETSSATTESEPVETSSVTTESDTAETDIWDAINAHTCSPEDDVLSNHWHKESTVTVEATKDNPGEIQDVCKDCGKVFDRVEYFNYFDDDTIFRDKENAEASLLAYNLVDELGLNSGNKSDLEKLCILKKWFCDNTRYEQPNHTGYELLKDHTGVCMAYGEALCLILPKCGIETLYCGGFQDHAFNLVKINGQWTYTDFTEGDDFDVDVVVLGTSYHGVPHGIYYEIFDEANGQRNIEGNVDDLSVSTELHVYDLNGNELKSQMEDDGFSYVDSNGQGRKYNF